MQPFYRTGRNSCLMNCISFEWIHQVILQLCFDVHSSVKRIGCVLSCYADAELDSFPQKRSNNDIVPKTQVYCTVVCILNIMRKKNA